MVERYLLQTARLTASSGLNGATGMRMSFTQEGGLVSDANFPSHEAVSALTTLFRQVDSPEERASFGSVMRILQRLARDGTADERERVDALAVWGRAARSLHGKRAERLAMEKMGYPWPDDDSTPTPERLISIYFYGEHVHWDADKARQIEAWSAEPFVEHLYRYRFYEAVAPLANVYIMFGVFVRHVIRASDETLAA